MVSICQHHICPVENNIACRLRQNYWKTLQNLKLPREILAYKHTDYFEYKWAFAEKLLVFLSQYGLSLFFATKI